MRKNFDKLVWIILIAAFCIFWLLVVGVPLAVRAYLVNATIETPALVERISGTILVQRPRDPEPIGVSTVADPNGQSTSRTRNVRAGSVITTDDVSRAVLTFQRETAPEAIVLCTVQMYHNTRLSILEARSPRFNVSSRPDRITLRLDAGQIRIAPAQLEKETPHVTVLTPQAHVTLTEGSYSIRVTEELSEVVVRFGKAIVEAGSKGVALKNGQRIEVRAGEELSNPLPAAQNLVVNGDFVSPLSPSWQIDTLQTPGNPVPGEVAIVTSGGRKAVFFSRMGKDGIHSEVGISQVINRDVLDFESLVVRLDVKLLHQSLSGGGYLSSEFPVMVRVDYKDVYGIDRFWIHGFYYQNVDGYPIQLDTWGRPIGEQIPHAVWYPYESDNLLIALGDIRPARIHSIRIYASGWNFQSMVSEVGLIAK